MKFLSKKGGIKMKIMEIGKLNQHCENCKVIEYCGDPFYYCLCQDRRFENMDVDNYEKLAEKVDFSAFTPHPPCIGCERDCNDCEEDSDAKDVLARFIADKVAEKIINCT
ncbi:MAG: hypothetical protein PHV93_04955 [Candidatus Pacebacteria bacterium]|jgi:hypothetical protein|nr:hypothetical protein [Candidatus Paceibacterota bacterium]